MPDPRRKQDNGHPFSNPPIHLGVISATKSSRRLRVSSSRVKSILRIAPGKSPGVAVLGLYDGAMATKSPPKMSLIMIGEWV